MTTKTIAQAATTVIRDDAYWVLDGVREVAVRVYNEVNDTYDEDVEVYAPTAGFTSIDPGSEDGEYEVVVWDGGERYTGTAYIEDDALVTLHGYL